MKLKTLLLVTTLAFSALAPAASTLTATLTKMYPSITTQGTYTGNSYTSIHSGVLTFTSGDSEFLAFCGEPTQTISLKETVTFNISALASTELAQVMAKFLSSSRDSLNAQGAQWAMWELIRDDKPNFSNGLVKLPNGLVRDIANEYLDTYTSFTPAENVVLLSSLNRQDMIACIPEPRAALLGGLGVIALLRRRRV